MNYFIKDLMKEAYKGAQQLKKSVGNFLSFLNFASVGMFLKQFSQLKSASFKLHKEIKTIEKCTSPQGSELLFSLGTVFSIDQVLTDGNFSIKILSRGYINYHCSMVWLSKLSHNTHKCDNLIKKKETACSCQNSFKNMIL